MSEVTTWNATDNANTAAPPDGFPEGMQPSAVNDGARMMMGALRREHDRITAQIGSVAGTINTTNITAVTVNTTGAITASGPITGSAINSTGNGSIAGTLTAGAVSTGSLTATGTVTAGLDVVANRNVSALGNSYAGFDLHAGRDVIAVGNVQGSTVTSTGSISATLDVTAGRNASIAGTSYVGGLATFNAVNVQNDLHMIGHPLYTNNAIVPTVDNTAYVGVGALAFAGMYAYAYVTASDADLKTDIETPQGCLALVEAISPRTYHFRDRPDEAQHWGFVAQEVGAAMQAAGREFAGHRVDAESGREGLVYPELVAVLWGAVQELTQQVEALKREKADV